ncbi:spiroplasma plectrovirus-related protein [Spiroplasma phoeniceum P40]|uniref:Spiroplasma plectrovirus-related protein n=1 Tax=Spiroplasma phoeniceum P40 TaxID=1276259 RepID=A0A345DR21_9MOLU|nr:spiroplasma plectrovirus-related protein [Spiroplasma phoeniceum P40]
MVFSLYKNIYKFVNLLIIQIINLKVIIKIIISEIIVLIGDTIHDNQKIDGITFVKNEFIISSIFYFFFIFKIIYTEIKP